MTRKAQGWRQIGRTGGPGVASMADTVYGLSDADMRVLAHYVAAMP